VHLCVCGVGFVHIVSRLPIHNKVSLQRACGVLDILLR
jgi:hypothetical protein